MALGAQIAQTVFLNDFENSVTLENFLLPDFQRILAFVEREALYDDAALPLQCLLYPISNAGCRDRMFRKNRRPARIIKDKKKSSQNYGKKK